jgi:signal transduction histidine kinase/ligand-binding sensor domain-containing protein
MTKLRGRERAWVAPALVLAWTLLAPQSAALALNPSLEVNQYAHHAWTVRDGFSLGNVYAMAQTPDGYLWLGTEFGLFRFDGVRFVRWDPPAGQQLPEKNINSLLVSRDGSLWIGTFAGLVIWRDGKLTRPPALETKFIASLFEDHEGTVWVGALEQRGLLCAMRSGRAECFGEDGAFGRAVWALHEDSSSGTVWAAAESGLWRMKPGPPRRYATAMELIGVNKSDDGRLLIAMHGAGLMQLVGDRLEAYPVLDATNPKRPLADRDVDANKLLRDRDGGLWIGTVERGLVHVHNGRAVAFRQLDGLSGDVILCLFEDREGNMWVASTGGLDRFRELPVTTISVKQGLSSDATQSVLAATDGSIWVGAVDALTRWKNRQTTVFRKGSGLPDAPHSLYQDHRGRVWTSTRQGLAYFMDGRFVGTGARPGGRVHYITGDDAGNLWLSGHEGLVHLRDGRLVKYFPWSELGRPQSAEILLPGREPGALWLGFWVPGGVSHFMDGQLRASYTTADGLGEGTVGDLYIGHSGALWAATQGGLSRLKDGRIATLTTKNGLPCNTVIWAIQDNDRSFWLYTACGLVLVTRPELDAWVADPTRRIAMTTWDAADGVRLRSSAASEYGPRVTKSTDGKLWFVTGEGVQVVDPHHLVVNRLPPPVQIEQITADRTAFDASPGLKLPPLVRDLAVEYTALSLAAPEKVRFRYKLEGYDNDWHEAGNRRQAFYTNLPPRPYRFRVIACNNSGVWNEAGAAVDFSIAPALYQTNWFRALFVALAAALVWAAWQLRVRQLAGQLEMTLDARVAERTRIARDLHDTLLQDFQGLLLLFERALRLLPEQPVEAKHRLQTALQQAVHATTQARNAVQGLRLSEEADDLVSSITKIRDELAVGADTHTQIRVAIDGPPRPLRPLVSAEVHRIADEALRNAIRHASAEQIVVEISFDQHCFRLRVRDDGKGIDDQAVRNKPSAGHFGLQGMRERAEVVSGRLEVWSKTGSGTVIQLSVPPSAAYAESPPRPALWQRLFRHRDA